MKGVPDVSIESARDSDDPKPALIELLLNAHKSGAASPVGHLPAYQALACSTDLLTILTAACTILRAVGTAERGG